MISRAKFQLSNSGFTLLEVIVAISIIVLISAAALTSFINSRNIRDLTTSGQNVLSVLRLAQSKALGGEDNAKWGVRLEQAQYILFRGPSYAGSTLTENFSLPASIEIANITLSGGGQEIVFERLDGNTNQSGTLDVRVKGSGTQIFSLTIDTSGKVYQTGTAPVPAGTRIVDLRHRAFTLGWSIKNSVTLTLTFSDPPNLDVVYPVVMMPVPPRTTFDWSGTVVVGGQNQTLRIHAPSITDTSTILHVDRDCRRNTKKVKISIDTSDIATYEADCRTMTVWPTGGTVSEP